MVQALVDDLGEPLADVISEFFSRNTPASQSTEFMDQGVLALILHAQIRVEVSLSVF